MRRKIIAVLFALAIMNGCGDGEGTTKEPVGEQQKNLKVISTAQKP